MIGYFTSFRGVVKLIILILFILASTFLFADFECINELNSNSDFIFFIFSDNHGHALENAYFKRMDEIRVKSNARFAIGVGDHVKRHRNQPFLDLITDNQWWHDNFFPNIADGENEVFGSSQGDWGSGGELLKHVSFAVADSVYLRENGAEYYARMQVNDFTVHIIQLHFPDTPRNTSLSFRQESRDFLIKTLEDLKITQYDIVIVAAHSMSGFWHHLLSNEEQNILLSKADLILSGTSHIFDRVICPLNHEDGALILNPGSVTDPFFFSPPGFLQVNVLNNPVRLVVQFVDVRNEEYEIAPVEKRFIRK